MLSRNQRNEDNQSYRSAVVAELQDGYLREDATGREIGERTRSCWFPSTARHLSVAWRAWFVIEMRMGRP